MSEFDDFFDDFGWEEMGMLGALAEEMSEDEKEKRRLEKELDMEEPAEREEDEEKVDPCCWEGGILNPDDDDCQY